MARAAAPGSGAPAMSSHRPASPAPPRLPPPQAGGGAAKNPRAPFKTPITVEDVLNSRMIAYPFRLLQCCLVTDGGGALILVSAERARDFLQSLPLATNRGPVYLLGTGESGETPKVN